MLGAEKRGENEVSRYRRQWGFEGEESRASRRQRSGATRLQWGLAGEGEERVILDEHANHNDPLQWGLDARLQWGLAGEPHEPGTGKSGNGRY